MAKSGIINGDLVLDDAIQDTPNSKINKALTITAVTASPTLTNADNGKVYHVSTSFSFNFPNGLDTGFAITLVKTDSNATTVTLTASTTLNSKSSYTKLKDAYSSCTVYHQGSNVWVALGDLVA